MEENADLKVTVTEVYIGDTKADTVKDEVAKVRSRFAVEINVESAGQERGSWVSISGQRKEVSRAKGYIKAILEPEDTATMKIPRCFHSEITAKRVELEDQTRAVIALLETGESPDFQAVIQGDRMAVALALSSLEDVISKLSDAAEENADDDSEKQDQQHHYSTSTSSRLDQTLLAMSDQFDIDKENLDKIPDVVKRLIVSWVCEDDADGTVVEQICLDDEEDEDTTVGDGDIITLSETGVIGNNSTRTSRVSTDPSAFGALSKVTSTPCVTNAKGGANELDDITPIRVENAAGDRPTDGQSDASFNMGWPPSSGSTQGRTTIEPINLSDSELEDGELEDTVVETRAIHKEVKSGSNTTGKKQSDVLKEKPGNATELEGNELDATVIEVKETKVTESDKNKKMTKSKEPRTKSKDKNSVEVITLDDTDGESPPKVPGQQLSLKDKEANDKMIEGFVQTARQMGYDEVDIARANSILVGISKVTEDVYFKSLSSVSKNSQQSKRLGSPTKPEDKTDKRFKESVKDEPDARFTPSYGLAQPVYNPVFAPSDVSTAFRAAQPRATAPSSLPPPRLQQQHQQQHQQHRQLLVQQQHHQHRQLLVQQQHQQQYQQPPCLPQPPRPQQQQRFPATVRSPQPPSQSSAAALLEANLRQPMKKSSPIKLPPALPKPSSQLPPMPLEARPAKRMVVLDGSNIAYGHSGLIKEFSCRGLVIAIQTLENRYKCENIKCIVPMHKRSDRRIRDKHLLHQLDSRNYIIYSPSKRLNNRYINPYDDRLILDLARETNGLVVSNDRYLDFINDHRYKDLVENRVLMFTFCDDFFYIPEDPMGRDGPSLQALLRDLSR